MRRPNILMVLAFLLSAFGISALAENSESALSALIRLDADRAQTLDESERLVLEALTVDQLSSFLRGTPPNEIDLQEGGTLAELLAAHGETSLSVPWFTIDGGGGTSAGDAYRLTGTIGQSDASGSIGGGFLLQGGFLPGVQTANDCANSSTVFCNGFERGNCGAWTRSLPGC